MFKFTFRDRSGKEQDYMDVITVNIQKLALSKMAIEKAVNMIAHAIAKSEFVVEREDGRVKDHVYWILNVRPNSNETATDFWIEVIKKALIEQECAVCYLGQKLYMIDSFSVDDTVMMPQTYRDVVISSNGKSFKIGRTFTSDEIIHLKLKNEKIKNYLEQILTLYNDTVSVMCAAQKIHNTPKFSLNVETSVPVVRSKNEDGTDKILTIDEYKENVKKLLESDAIEILTNSAGLKIEQFQTGTATKSEDITKMAHEIFLECALAFDIPKAVFLGEITEKADSTNEFITFAISWIKEIIEDSLNAKVVGEKDYLKGECIWIDMSRFKHVDIIESAGNLDKLRAIGFNFDEILKMAGWHELNTEFSKERVITKNYTNDLGGEKKNEE